jgi:hypothetical protein
MTNEMPDAGRRAAVTLPPGGVRDLSWGLKESFRAYFERLPDHAYEAGGGARRTRDGRLVYPARAGSADEPVDPECRRVLAFGGRVVLTAHFGALSVAIGDPEVRVDPSGRGDLSAVVDEDRGRPVRMVIARLNAESAGQGAGGPWVSFSATLAQEGQYLFMGNYFAGDPMDPVMVHFRHADEA